MTTTEITNPFVDVSIAITCAFSQGDPDAEPCNTCEICCQVNAEFTAEQATEDLENSARRFSGLKTHVTPPASLRAALHEAAIDYVVALLERVGHGDAIPASLVAFLKKDEGIS